MGTEKEMKEALRFLNQSQLDDWKRDGFLVLPNFVPEADCIGIKEHADQLVKDLQGEWKEAIFSTKDQEAASNSYFLDSGSRVSIFMEEEAPELPNKLGHAMHDLDPQFSALCRRPKMADLAGDIGFESPLLLQSMLIFKHPGFGGEVKPHQDSTFLCTNPASVVGFWLALDDANQENACLWAIPGGHQEALREQMVRDGNDGIAFNTLDARPLPEDGYVPLEVKRGTLVLLHGSLPHKSESNRSANSRYAFTLHVIEGNAEYKAENWLQRKADLPLAGF